MEKRYDLFAFHGFNTLDGGTSGFDKILPYFTHANVTQCDYPWTFLFRLRWRNDKMVREWLPKITEDSLIVAHSNGCAIAHELATLGAPVKAVICLQPALRRDAPWPDHVRVLCLYNEGDKMVRAGLVWSWFASFVNPFRETHKWGAAGHYGFDPAPNVESWNTNVPPPFTLGHNDLYTNRVDREYWGPNLNVWADMVMGT